MTPGNNQLRKKALCRELSLCLRMEIPRVGSPRSPLLLGQTPGFLSPPAWEAAALLLSQTPGFLTLCLHGRLGSLGSAWRGRSR